MPREIGRLIRANRAWLPSREFMTATVLCRARGGPLLSAVERAVVQRPVSREEADTLNFRFNVSYLTRMRPPVKYHQKHERTSWRYGCNTFRSVRNDPVMLSLQEAAGGDDDHGRASRIVERRLRHCPTARSDIAEHLKRRFGQPSSLPAAESFADRPRSVNYFTLGLKNSATEHPRRPETSLGAVCPPAMLPLQPAAPVRGCRRCNCVFLWFSLMGYGRPMIKNKGAPALVPVE